MRTLFSNLTLLILSSSSSKSSSSKANSKVFVNANNNLVITNNVSIFTTFLLSFLLPCFKSPVLSAQISRRRTDQPAILDRLTVVSCSSLLIF